VSPDQKPLHRTAVVILNWNGRHFLEKFIPEIILYSSSDADIIVADNASTDDSVEYLKKKFPSVTIIQNKFNEGFTGGYNTALKQVNAEYYILLNSDVKVSENWIPPVIKLMDSSPDIAACQPKILLHDDPSLFEYAGAGGGFIDMFGYPFCRGRIFNTIEKDLNQYNDTREVFWASGACMFIRAKSFHEAGGFDSNFFAHMEEIDLCWRLKNSGFKIYYCGDSKVFHVGGGTLHKSNPRKTYLNFRNNLLMIWKNSSPEKRKKIMVLRIFLDYLAAFKFLLGSGFQDFRAVFRAHYDFGKIRRQYNLNRSEIQRREAQSFIYPHCILWDYYLCGRRKFSALRPPL
jgi:GT2 family glycosyltransferase